IGEFSRVWLAPFTRMWSRNGRLPHGLLPALGYSLRMPASGGGGEAMIWRRFMSDVSMVVNGRKVSGTVEDRTLLVHYLREHLGMTGTHVGCDTSQCGACVVHMDGKAVKSCSILAVQASGSEILTIEGLADGAELHPVQAAL